MYSGIKRAVTLLRRIPFFYVSIFGGKTKRDIIVEIKLSSAKSQFSHHGYSTATQKLRESTHKQIIPSRSSYASLILCHRQICPISVKPGGIWRP